MTKMNRTMSEEYGTRLISQALEKREWELISDIDQFAEHILGTLEHLDSNVDDVEKVIKRETVHQYSIVLYEASRANGTPSQQQAYKELWTYLFPVALYKTQDQERAEECTQQTLIQIWKKGHQCTDPGRFLGWAKVVLLRQILMSARKDHQGPNVMTWTEISQERSENSWEETTELGEPLKTPEEEIYEKEEIELLCQALNEALPSQAQRTVIEGLFIQGMGFAAVAEMLNTTPSNVYTLKSRALSSLRGNEQFRRLLADIVAR